MIDLKLIYLLILLSCSSLAYGQYGWVKHYESLGFDQYLYDIVSTQDGGYFMAGETYSSTLSTNNALLIRLDSDGDVVWRKEYPTLSGGTIFSVEELPNGGAIFVYEAAPTQTRVAGTTPTGTVVWDQNYVGNPTSTFGSYTSCDLKRTSDGNFILHDSHGSIFKITPSGTILWTAEASDLLNAPHLSPHGNNIIEVSPDTFVLLGGQEVGAATGNLNMQALLVDGTGVLKRSTLAPVDLPGISAIKTSDQLLVFCGNGNNNASDTLLLIKTDLELNPIWTRKHLIDTYPIDVWAIEEAKNGELWCLASEDYGGGAPSFVFIYVFDASGNYLRKINVSTDIQTTSNEYVTYGQFSLSIGGGGSRATLIKSKDGHLVLGVDVSHFGVGYPPFGHHGFAHVKIDTSSQISPTLMGKAFADYNTDCTFNTGDSLFGHCIVQATRVSDGQTHYAVSNVLGTYSMLVDTGTFTIQTTLPNPFYWQACPQQSVTFSGQIVDTLNLGIQQIATCPLLQVDLAAPFLRSTNGGSAYTVSVCNFGTANSPNTTVAVDFDSLLTITSASAAILSQVGNRYTFDVGNLAVAACTSFTVQVVVDTAVQFGQTLCTEARVYPDSICLPNYWAGPVIEVDGSCINDTLFFEITNTGSTMTSALTYYVFEDHVMMRQGTFQLNNGGIQPVIQPALPGKTYRLSAEQPPGIPYLFEGPLVTKAIEGCLPNSNGSFNTGFINQFSNGYRHPFTAIDCQVGIGAYDPNDKSAQPEGYQSQHQIDTTTIIDYKIRFQNTGNDTAFYVMIKDTLSPYLDPSSLQMGASSHPYTWTLQGDAVLKVTFPNIKLVDSTANEPLSHGFFRYSIRQTPNNPAGTVINNRAAIYFDYNPPIITNTTFHTISEDFVTIILTTEKRYQEEVEVTVYPNPFQEGTTLAVEGQEYESLTLHVYDVSGRVVQTLQATNSSVIKINRQHLAQGVYLYTLQGDGCPISTGKLVVQAR